MFLSKKMDYKNNVHFIDQDEKAIDIFKSDIQISVLNFYDDILFFVYIFLELKIKIVKFNL